ncbi:MAG: T9SS type A sorting domain-containing protein, partial [Bacteroidota bacterium]
GANTLPITALEVDPSTGKVYYTVSRILAQDAFDKAWQAITELNITNGESVSVLNSFSSRFSAFAIRTSEVAPYEYEWMPAENFDDPTLASQTTILEESTTFTVAVTDACETVMDEILVEVHPSVEVTIDTSIVRGETYNGIVIETDTTIMETVATETNCEIRTINITVIISSTQQTWASNAIQLSPNPTRSILNISTLGIEERKLEFRILDVHGRTLWQQNRQDLQEEIDVSEFMSGLYFLEIRSAEKVAVRQFVKL